MSDEAKEAGCLPCKDAKTRELFAWNDLMPPLPDYFHITGEVYVANPGVDPLLVPAEPQGINPTILILNLFLCQRPGGWPRVWVWKPVRYDKKIETGYTQVDIMCEGDRIATVDVQNVT
ncbi:hypothetical protein [Rhodobium gokarnense]|uniref:Uncharacterized protein n=1 Tax=Rhodobium gokarnense TaxID=364296 RepID=A0ABT3HHU8_9HYPH|nr:hypothetical protein [Rhodobium gokarnense]MCW2309986.1 hypothetical protein [Rhodobium gokarnense]